MSLSEIVFFIFLVPRPFCRQLCWTHLFITASPIFRSLPNRQSPDFVTRNRGSCIACTETRRRRLVADVHLAEAGNPSPAARSDHHNSAKASAVAMVPVAVMAAVIAATHSTTTLSPATCGSLGRDKRGGADGGRGGNSENRLADHESLLWLSLDVLLTSCPLVVRMIRRVQLRPQKATLCDCHHIASTNVGAKSRPCRCATLHLGEQRSELCVATNGLLHWRWWFCSRCHQQPGTPRA